MPDLTTEDIKDIAKLAGDDLVIALMGPTGAGKSNIIDALTNQPGRRAGSSLESRTTKVCAVRLINHPVHGDRLVLVDTPGFGDEKSDMQILEMISKWLQDVYEKDIRLAGIIYLHRITDNRMAGSPNRNLSMFGELCGDTPGKAMKKVVFVTTMWDQSLASASDEQRKILDKREEDLKDNYWKTMTKLGASTVRFTNSRASAEEIINFILQQHEAVLQEEIVDSKRAPDETQAQKPPAEQPTGLFARLLSRKPTWNVFKKNR